jgi:hypothetical protein
MLDFNPLSMMFFLPKNAINGAGVDNQFCEGLGPMDTWLKFYGTAEKKRR